MTHLDGFAATEVSHLLRIHGGDAHGADLARVAHDDLVPDADPLVGPGNADCEDAPLRIEVLDLDPMDVLGGEDRPAIERERELPELREHPDLRAVAEDAHVRVSAAERRTLQEGDGGGTELETRSVAEILLQTRFRGH